MKIFKYPLAINDRQEIDLPIHAKVLCVQTQNNQPQLWALVYETEAKETRVFKTYGTGNKLPDSVETEKYIGTYQLRGPDNVFVGHVFEDVGVRVAPGGTVPA